MKFTLYLFLIVSELIFSQEYINAKLHKNSPFNADTIVSIDNFGTIYYLKNNVLYKASNEKTISYNNLQLGDVTSANAFNPLKINLFYKDFNTVIILDNRLAEIYKIDFSTLSEYKNVSHITTGHDNTLWIFNQDSQKLELFDYKTKSIRAQTTPIQSTLLDVKSNYNYCYLLTQNNLYIYNYFGSLVMKMKNDGFTELSETNENIFLKKGNSLFYIKKNTKNIIPVLIPDLLINQFFVTNETLYISANNILYEFKIKID